MPLVNQWQALPKKLMLPSTYIYGSINYVDTYTRDLLEVLQLYAQ
ncbi:hypothetical protein [Leptolyngbya sp. Cla-17]|nr:hypothetical protein [Leptolyngbya sp. Cla-17]